MIAGVYALALVVGVAWFIVTAGLLEEREGDRPSSRVIRLALIVELVVAVAAACVAAVWLVFAVIG